MGSEDLLWAVLIVAIAIVLVSAAVSDVRTRRASDAHWRIMGAAGVSIMSFILCERYGQTVAVAYLLGAAMLLWYVLDERIVGSRAVPVLAAGLCLIGSTYVIGSGTDLISSIVMFSMFLIGFHTGVIHGGADAKCYLTLCLILPIAPDPIFSCLPASAPALKVFLYAAIAVAVCEIPFIVVRNIRSGDPAWRLLSYMKKARDIDLSREWPVGLGRAGDDEMRARLDPMGGAFVRVTPMVPFLAPTFFGFLLVLLI